MTYFNEGGADCPPKALLASPAGGWCADFNEGGADCPPKATCSKREGDCWGTSMKGGRTAPRKMFSRNGLAGHTILQ